MATFTTACDNGYTLELVVSETPGSVNTTNNTSTVTWTLSIISDAYHSFSSWGSTCTVTINGTSVYNTTTTKSMGKGSKLQIATGTTSAITHNSDGSKSVICAATWHNSSASYMPNDGSISNKTLVLTTIPRTSTCSMTSPILLGNTGLVINTNRASTSLTHTLSLIIDNVTVKTLKTGVGASYTWNVSADASLIYPYMTSLTHTAVIRCQTFSGATSLGTTDTTVTLQLNNTDIPTFTALNYTQTNANVLSVCSNNAAAIISGVSTVQVSFTGGAGYQGSTIKTYVVKQGTKIWTSTTQPFNITDINSSTDLQGYIIDSRGMQSSLKTKAISPFYPYSVPTLSDISSLRQGDVGTTGLLSFVVKIADVCTSKATFKYAYKLSTDSSYSTTRTVTPTKTVTTGDTDDFKLTNYTILNTSGTTMSHTVDKSYDYKLTVSDGISTVSFYAVLPKASPELSIRQGCVGIGVIPTVDSSALQVAGDISVTGGINFGTNKLIYEVNTWTPTLQSLWSDGTTWSSPAGYTAQAGEYQRIGNRCYITGIIIISGSGNLPAGTTLYIRGLPFAPTKINRPIAIPRFTSMPSISGLVGLSGITSAGNNGFMIYAQLGTTSAAFNPSTSQPGAGFALYIEGFYDI